MLEGSQTPERLDAVLEDEELVDYDFEHEDEPELQPIPDSIGHDDTAIDNDDMDASRPPEKSAMSPLKSASPDRASSPAQQAEAAGQDMQPTSPEQHAQEPAVGQGMRPTSPERPAREPAHRSETTKATRAERSARPEGNLRAASRRAERTAEQRNPIPKDRQPRSEMRTRSKRQDSGQTPRKGTRYFLLKSISLENVEISVAEGIWATQVCSVILGQPQPTCRPCQQLLQDARSAKCQAGLVCLNVCNM